MSIIPAMAMYHGFNYMDSVLRMARRSEAATATASRLTGRKIGPSGWVGKDVELTPKCSCDTFINPRKAMDTSRIETKRSYDI